MLGKDYWILGSFIFEINKGVIKLINGSFLELSILIGCRIVLATATTHYQYKWIATIEMKYNI